ncbi:hypothetical protein AMS68_005985 [Peltaster fructicola]|uniref:TPR-like protein n=1 Tax=Peltaster fructicola TaxID=286661 RepID=A0A6H0Y0V0_9PEZI|nr:hypothetical protein AMS68_005985 [Peltaster fructicola]
MSGNKAALKAAKAALDANDFDETVKQAEAVLSNDAQNYNARLLLGRAQEKKGSLDSAESTYRAAAKSKTDDTQALSGLCSVYTAQGAKNIDAYIDVTIQLAELFANADDKERCQSAVNKLTGFVRQHGKPAQIRRALAITLPESSLYETLEGRVPAPSHTYLRLAESLEAEEKQSVNQEIAQRRTRIGAKLGQVTAEVKLEILSRSELEQLYRQVINWTNDDDVRRQYEEKLLEHAYELLTVVPLEGKAEQLDKVLTLAEGAVVVHHPFQLAWDLYLESRDLDNLQDLDLNDLLAYVKYFPNDGLARVIHAWLNSDLSPYKIPETQSDEQPLEPLSAEDRLLMITEGLSRSERSPFASRLAADFFLSLDEYETAIQTARTGIQALASESQKLGMTLQNTRDALNSVLGTALVVYQAPRNHAEARRLLEEILQRKPRFTLAFIGLGLIFEEMEQYEKAIQFLQQALVEDATNIRIGVELAWCKALHGDYATAQEELETYLPQLTEQDPKSRNLRAQCLYRIGVCVWQRDSSKTARKDRNGAYSRFLAAIKTDVEFAPAYTSLGRYYEQYAKDKKRARQCYQKAFELSPAETDAAERLAKSFADQGDWEIVEVVAQRVIDSGRARPPPGSKRQGLSWPYSALGVAQMNKLEYQQAIVSFLAALRINPADYQSYVGLGESYHNSGRYNSASRTFNYALQSVVGTTALDETWFARYMLANVHRELGEYDEAISGLINVLKDHPTEFGVLLSLQQTYIEKAWHCVESALFGQALESANNAIATASTILGERPNAFNMWKGLGDACLIFSWVQSGITQFPEAEITTLLDHGDKDAYNLLADVDNVTLEAYKAPADDRKDLIPTDAALLAFKRAIQACSSDPHAQAVAWYNLGYAEQRAYTCSSIKSGKSHLKAAVRCFKRAIELEAGNAEFWNALGVVTTMLNPRVAQHSLVRSLHINELNAKVWTNLGVLYMLQGDYELAHQAFGRAQSTDPEYAHAWIGEGLIALMTGDAKTALNDFTHAFEISDSWSTITKRQYSMSSFDNLITSPAASNDLTTLIQPLFALEQLHMQVPKDLPFRHLAALFLERVGSHIEAIEVLSELCTVAETEYEMSENLASLARFAHAKADLARNQLAAHDFDKAAENAETALDLSAEADESGLDHEERRKLRLSAHMTAGLALNSLGKSPEAISMFRIALGESENDPDVVSVLVKMLWSNGGIDEKTAARDQLFDCVERFPEHAGCVTLLGAIAALDDDKDTMAAVRDDLLSLRTGDRLSLDARNDIERLLGAFAGLNDNNSGKDTAITEAQAAILLDPSDNLAWTQLAELSDDPYPPTMALKCAQSAVPPNGDMTSEDLGKTFALAGTVRNSQHAIALAPWIASS